MDLENMTSAEKQDIAKSPDTNVDVLLELTQDKDLWVRYYVATNSKTPEESLRHLALDSQSTVRSIVGDNPNTPEDVLRNLIKNKHFWTILRNVARNPNTPYDVLQELSKDRDPNVREHVVYNPNVSSTLLIMLFEHEKSLKRPSKDVIKTLYRHKKLPEFAKRLIETLFGEMLN